MAPNRLIFAPWDFDYEEHNVDIIFFFLKNAYLDAENDQKMLWFKEMSNLGIFC